MIENSLLLVFGIKTHIKEKRKTCMSSVFLTNNLQIENYNFLIAPSATHLSPKAFLSYCM